MPIPQSPQSKANEPQDRTARRTANRKEFGNLLRMVGPLIQLPLLWLLLNSPGTVSKFAPLIYSGMAAGFVLVVYGNYLRRKK